MTNYTQEELERRANLHTVGAIINHTSPFEHLPSYKKTVSVTADFIKEWVVPYYMTIARFDQDWIIALQKAKPRITKDICWLLLGDFNWRTRLVGSYLASVKGYTEITQKNTLYLFRFLCAIGKIQKRFQIRSILTNKYLFCKLSFILITRLNTTLYSLSFFNNQPNYF